MEWIIPLVDSMSYHVRHIEPPDNNVVASVRSHCITQNMLIGQCFVGMSLAVFQYGQVIAETKSVHELGKKKLQKTIFFKESITLGAKRIDIGLSGGSFPLSKISPCEIQVNIKIKPRQLRWGCF